MGTQLPQQARVVIIGGGVIGTSIAYHLAHAGWKDTVLIEKNEITSGTTWHAAGLMVTFGSTSETSTELRKYTRDLYSKLEAETGVPTGFKDVGFIEVASNKDRLEEYRRVSAFNRLCGIDVHEISPQEIQDLFPIAKVDDLQAGFYVKEDGRVNPVDCTMSMAKGARMQGAKIIENTTVTKINTKNGAIDSVETNRGIIKCEYIVNCAGMWARQLGEQNGVNIPNQAAEHYYLITEESEDIPKNMPVLEDPSHHGYYRDEVGALMIGLFEPVCAPWNVKKIPADFHFGEIGPDWDRMTPYLEKAMSRVPMTMKLGLKKFFCGPESFTPDLSPIVGEAPEIKNYFVCAGLNSIGILTGGGMGRMMAHWIVNGRPDMDITCMNIERLHRYQNTPKYRAARTVESLGMVYRAHYPFMSLQTARNCKVSPFHERMKAKGAYFGDVSGWEAPAWFAPEGKEPKVEKLSWQRENWFPYWEAEHKAARENVIIMDMSFMGKFLVQGADAGKALNYICANDVDGDLNTITYTQCLNEQGKLEADITVAKLAIDKFLVVVTDTQHRHLETWIKRNIPENMHACITDITSGYGQLNVQGPNSRALLQKLCDTDLSNEAFPFRRAKEISIGFAKALCIRITYLGELGYELYIPSDQALHVYDQVVAEGEKNFDLKHAGLRALGSLRMEKGYRDYGHDIDNTDDPYETGLGFAVSLKKDSNFIGRQFCETKKEAKPYNRRLAQVLCLDPEPMMYHAEVIWRNGQRAGYIRAASYGHTLGGAVGLAMIEGYEEKITPAWIKESQWEIEIANKKYPAKVSLAPMYDPKMERIKV